MFCRGCINRKSQLTAGPSLVLPCRGGKQKWGNITRDPYKTFQKKLDRKNAQMMGKIPLKSEERALRDLDYPLNLQSLGQMISEYTPPERFARFPLYTRQGWSQRWRSFKENLQTIYGGAVIRRKLKKIEPFRPIEFARWGQDQFIAANQAIQSKDKNSLRQITTETASESLRSEFRNKVFKWEFIEETDRPRVVNARAAPLSSKDNLYGQLVVRMHSQQILAVYDMAGRLIKGHPSKSKKVIDYVVFERSLSATDASWRICGKLPPQIPTRPQPEN